MQEADERALCYYASEGVFWKAKDAVEHLSTQEDKKSEVEKADESFKNIKFLCDPLAKKDAWLRDSIASTQRFMNQFKRRVGL